METAIKNSVEESVTKSVVLAATLTAEETLARLQEMDDPGALVQSIPPHDLLVVWNMADDEQRADLLKLADKSQVDLLVDLKCWKGDTPSMDTVEELIGPLVMSSVDGAMRAIGIMDGELRTLLLKRSARVHVLENRNDDLVVPDTSELIACPDGYYYIELPEPDLVTDVERALLQALLLKPVNDYQPELECIRHELASDLTEMAYKWHCARLADYGFATREEALSLMAPCSVEEVRQAALNADPIAYFPSEIALPVLYRDSLRGNDFLDQVMELIAGSDDETTLGRMASLATELTAMTNLYLSATGVDLGDIDAVSRQISWVRDMLSLGLSEVSNGDEEEGARLLTRLSPGIFLKAAWGILYPLRNRARKILEDHKLRPVGRRGAIFDPPYYIGLDCLARDIPCYWPDLFKKDRPQHSLLEPGIDALAAFSTKKEVARAEQLLEEAEQLPTLLFDTLKSEHPPVRGTPASILVMNALANAASERDPVPRPILKEEANVFASELLSMSEDQLISDALAVFSPLVDVSLEDSDNPDDDSEPMHRLLIRLIRIGRARLAADAPERALLIESF
jgi:hypothetical protein